MRAEFDPGGSARNFDETRRLIRWSENKTYKLERSINFNKRKFFDSHSKRR